MTAHSAPIPRPSKLYFIEQRSPRVRGAWFGEVDRDTNSRDRAIELIRTGDVDPVKVLEIDEDAGTCRDVTDEICAEAEREAEPVTAGDRLDWKHDHQRGLTK